MLKRPTSSSLSGWMSSMSLCASFSSFSHCLEKKTSHYNRERYLCEMFRNTSVCVRLYRTVRVSSRRGGGSTQLMSLRSTSIMADVSICFRTRERNPSFRRRKLSTWRAQSRWRKRRLVVFVCSYTLLKLKITSTQFLVTLTNEVTDKS